MSRPGRRNPRRPHHRNGKATPKHRVRMGDNWLLPTSGLAGDGWRLSTESEEEHRAWHRAWSVLCAAWRACGLSDQEAMRRARAECPEPEIKYIPPTGWIRPSQFHPEVEAFVRWKTRHSDERRGYVSDVPVLIPGRDTRHERLHYKNNKLVHEDEQYIDFLTAHPEVE